MGTGYTINLPIAFKTKAFRAAAGYQYYNNNLAAVDFTLTTVSLTGGPAGVSGYVNVFIIGY